MRWIEWIPQEQLHEHYCQHDALLFPSLRDSGGMVVLEAWRMAFQWYAPTAADRA